MELKAVEIQAIKTNHHKSQIFIFENNFKFRCEKQQIIEK